MLERDESCSDLVIGTCIRFPRISSRLCSGGIQTFYLRYLLPIKVLMAAAAVIMTLLKGKRFNDGELKCGRAKEEEDRTVYLVTIEDSNGFE